MLRERFHRLFVLVVKTKKLPAGSLDICHGVALLARPAVEFSERAARADKPLIALLCFTVFKFNDADQA
jgi:hypothetical protein